MGEFTHAMRNPIRERDDRIHELESVLEKAREFINSATLFDGPGSPGVSLALEVQRVCAKRPKAAPAVPKCKNLDCALCHGLPPNAGPR